MIDLSLNEVETLAARAARGAGLAWGLADDIGRAARRLAEAGLDWTAPILRLVAAPVAGAELAAVGAEFADRPDLLGTMRVAEPALVAALAAGSGEARRFAWTGGAVAVGGGRIVSAEGEGLSGPGPAEIHVTADPAGPPAQTALGRALAEPAALAVLGAVIARLYVPASERSRASGAGAAIDDND